MRWQWEPDPREIGWINRRFNAGVAGDTFGAMLARLDYYVPARTQITILQGGYNDVQRGSDSGSIAGSIRTSGGGRPSLPRDPPDARAGYGPRERPPARAEAHSPIP